MIDKIKDKIVQLGAANVGVVSVKDMVFDESFRDICASNACGKYNRSWTCPPGVGVIKDLIKKATSYKKALVYQTISEIEDSFDIEGMLEAGKRHNTLSIEIINYLAVLGLKVHKQGEEITADSKSDNEVLLLGAGGCSLCNKCAKIDNEPCRNPEYAIPSLEAYGISVYDLAKDCGMNYINGQNTVTYFGAILFM